MKLRRTPIAGGLPLALLVLIGSPIYLQAERSVAAPSAAG